MERVGRPTAQRNPNGNPPTKLASATDFFLDFFELSVIEQSLGP